MNRDRHRLPDYLAHILRAIDRIGRYTAGMDESTFLSNGLTQDAVIRKFDGIYYQCWDQRRMGPTARRAATREQAVAEQPNCCRPDR